MKDPTDTARDDATGGAVERRSRELFDEQVANLDAHTRSRLNRARQAALATLSDQARSPWNSRWLLPVGSAAAVTLVALSAVQLMRTGREDLPGSAPVVVASTVDDVEILTSSEELDMLQNVDFYAWLDTQQDGQQDSVEAEHHNSEAG